MLLVANLIRMLLKDSLMRRGNRTLLNSKEPTKGEEEATNNRISNNTIIWEEAATLRIPHKPPGQQEEDNKEVISSI